MLNPSALLRILSGHPYRIAAASCALILLGLILELTVAEHLRIPDYGGWHSLLEALSISISFAVAMMAGLYTRGAPRYPLFAVGFLLVALLDGLHLVSYAGQPDFFSPATTQKAIVPWLAARFVLALTFAQLLLPTRWQQRLVFPFGIGGIVIAIWGVALPDTLPALYVPGSGLTLLKQVLEWSVCLIYLALAWGIRLMLPRNNPNDWLAAGLLVLGCGELLFSVYRQADSVANGMGHLFKLLGQGFFLISLLQSRVITPYRELEFSQRRLRESESRLNALFKGAPVGVLLVDNDGNIVHSNARADTIFSATAGLKGYSVDQLLPFGHRHAHAQKRAEYLSHADTRSMSNRPILAGQRLDGEMLNVQVALSPIEWEGQSMTAAFVSDVSQQVEQMRHLEWLSEHDPLTALPNRTAANMMISAMFAARDRKIVVVVSLDALKNINQVFGHETGDRLLQAAADRLRAALRPGEMLARLEGDNFLLLLPRNDDSDTRAQALLASLDAPFVLSDEVTLQVRVSGGLCYLPEDGDSAEQFLQHAELALASAKRSQKRGLVGFEAAQPDRSRRWLDLAGRLQGAIANHELHLVYQPRIALATNTVAGFEVLVRWDSGGAAISPAEFIPIAEESGQMPDLGRWIFNTAFDQLAQWQAQGLDVGCVAINLSTQQMADNSLAAFLAERLAAQGLDASKLELEITETAAMENLDWAIPRMATLRQLGFQIALDDFGTGYSSLAYLQSLPLAVLKIDIAFVSRLDDPAGQAVAQTIIALAQSLGLRTVAEGVETAAQRTWLHEHQCDEIQGFLESRPIRAEAVPELLARYAPPAD
ncbi:EAL domain-containing protein [Chitinimonas sp. BJYL2]|uniref:bifunctional diguanylate cyclase/phosphodiesterase n=1 Tax=Chitinimonas sp. BJYL2 TaxID=2976696 RepID=UPI0022B5CB27|nr:EAL domain-containing protein [Chitinimonas sp. BJYL2]